MCGVRTPARLFRIVAQRQRSARLRCAPPSLCCVFISSPPPPHHFTTSPPHDHVTHHVTTLGRGAGSVFHARCCICADCGADLTVGQAGQVVLGADRSLRCVGCEKRRRGDVCDSCGGVLMEHFVAALGGRFHDTCVLQGVSLFRDLAPPCARAAPRGAPTNDARKQNNSRSPLPTPHKPHTTTNRQLLSVRGVRHYARRKQGELRPGRRRELVLCSVPRAERGRRCRRPLLPSHRGLFFKRSRNRRQQRCDDDARASDERLRRTAI